MEADLDKSEVVKPRSGELCGERLLHTYYVSTAPSGGRRRKVCFYKHSSLNRNNSKISFNI